MVIHRDTCHAARQQPYGQAEEIGTKGQPEQETASQARQDKKQQNRRGPEVQKATLKGDFSDGWKKFKKEAGVVFLGDAIRERSDAARDKGVISFQPYNPEVGVTGVLPYLK